MQPISRTIEVCGETLELLPERALYRPANKTLHVADLHWGKAEVFQRSGVAVSSEILLDDLLRLSHAIWRTKAERLIVLGDLIHAPSGVTENVSEVVSRWRETHPDLKIDLVRGNHDRDFVFPTSWRIVSHREILVEPPFLLAHDQSFESEKLHLISGHIHPVLRMKGYGDSLRLPCFAIGRSYSLVPAFSAFTGGQEVERRDWDRLFVLTPNAVIEI